MELSYNFIGSTGFGFLAQDNTGKFYHWTLPGATVTADSLFDPSNSIDDIALGYSGAYAVLSDGKINAEGGTYGGNFPIEFEGKPIYGEDGNLTFLLLKSMGLGFVALRSDGRIIKWPDTSNYFETQDGFDAVTFQDILLPDNSSEIAYAITTDNFIYSIEVGSSTRQVAQLPFNIDSIQHIIHDDDTDLFISNDLQVFSLDGMDLGLQSILQDQESSIRSITSNENAHSIVLENGNAIKITDTNTVQIENLTGVVTAIPFTYSRPGESRLFKDFLYLDDNRHILNNEHFDRQGIILDFANDSIGPTAPS